MTDAPDKYDWTKDDDSGPDFAPKLEPGPHYARVDRILFNSANRPDGYLTRAGDKQIMVIWQNGAGQEGLMSLTCSRKAGWKIRKTCSALGCDMQALADAGVSPEDFAYEEVANQYLLGKESFIMVSEQTATDAQGNPYLDIDPMKESVFRKEVGTFFGIAGDDEAIDEKIAELRDGLTPV